MKDNISDGNLPLPPQSSLEGAPDGSATVGKEGAHATDTSILQLFGKPIDQTDSTVAEPVRAPGKRLAPTSGIWRKERFRRSRPDAGFSKTGTEIEGTDEFFQYDGPDTVLTTFPASNPYKDQWGALRLVSADVRQHFLTGTPLVEYFRADPAAHAIDQLRTRLLQLLRANGWNRVAIAAPTPGCGTTFTAVNLAHSLARVPNSRNVLMDINNRTPGIAKMLNIDDVENIRSYIAGDVSMVRHLIRVSETLALGLTDETEPNTAEMLLDARCGPTLDRLNTALRPDVILYDLPPVLTYDDLVAFLPHIDGVLLVADGTQTNARQINECKRILKGKTQLLGVILNRTRLMSATGEEI